jgi:8-oxo-dGTP pyrophosphatase MutT (NUDIX family)
MKKIIELFKSLIEFLKNRKKVPYIPYPVSLSTVDIGIVSIINNDTVVLLGRKKDQTLFQFPGGFRDPGETSKEAAKRECLEETCLDLKLDYLSYVDELFINDVRYIDKPHKITTSIYYTAIEENEINLAKAGDDLVEVKWFRLDDLCNNYKEIIRPIHHQIFEILFIN